MALETVLLQIEMRRGRVKIRVKIIVLETVPLQIEMRSRRVKIRVKIIVLETVPFQIEMKSSWRAQGQKAPGDLAKNGRFRMSPEKKFNSRAAAPPNGRNLLPKGSRPGFGQKRPFPNDPRREIQ